MNDAPSSASLVGLTDDSEEGATDGACAADGSDEGAALGGQTYAQHDSSSAASAASGAPVRRSSSATDRRCAASSAVSDSTCAASCAADSAPDRRAVVSRRCELLPPEADPVARVNA